MGLQKLGFPWILSSGINLFNGLRRMSETIIIVADPPGSEPCPQPQSLQGSSPRSQSSHAGTMTRLLIFGNDLSALVAIPSEHDLR
jgi:hypothetical protein